VNRILFMSAAILLSLPELSTLVSGGSRRPTQVVTATSAPQSGDNGVEASQSRSKRSPCTPPNHVLPSIEETAWRLWVAATCPVNDSQYPYVVWENWIEQNQLYPTDPANGLKVPNSLTPSNGASHLLHASPLTLNKNPGLGTVIPGLLGAPDQSCNKSASPPPNQPNLVICEEVRLNGAAEDYIAGNGFWKRAGQQKAALVGLDIEFPETSVEVKADWIQLSTIGLDCGHLPPALTQSVHVETINGACFALAGMHVVSKLLDNWIWATFEPQNLMTNPNRCTVLGCTDSFGSKPARTNGATTLLTARLSELMAAADLAPEWKNYRLDGVQIFFTDGRNPTLLGNSIIEGENTGIPLENSSCITCHALSSVKTDGSDGIQFRIGNNPIGEPEPLPPDWIRRDFVWSLFAACPNAPFRDCSH
jgi:hypothetical protein